MYSLINFLKVFIIQKYSFEYKQKCLFVTNIIVSGSHQWRFARVNESHLVLPTTTKSIQHLLKLYDIISVKYFIVNLITKQ